MPISPDTKFSERFHAARTMKIMVEIMETHGLTKATYRSGLQSFELERPLPTGAANQSSQGLADPKILTPEEMEKEYEKDLFWSTGS